MLVMDAISGWSKDPRLATYTVGKVIGRGSYGEVFLVKHCKEKKQVRVTFDVAESSMFRCYILFSL